MSAWIITAVGPDRPGLVQTLTSRLLDASANVADSRMINLRGQFALILLAEIPDEGAQAVQDQLAQSASELGLSIEFCAASEAQALRTAAAVGVPYRLRIFAMDQPGIVHQITDVLHRSSVNVEELETRSQPSPQSGAPLFSMDVRITVPADVAIRELRGELTSVCDSLNCDLELTRDSLT